MKKILFLLITASQVLLAQIPQAFNYQGIARDLSGNPLAGKAIKVRLSILSEIGVNQTTLYSETHNVVTNQFGLFVLPVGKGTVVSGTFASIIWTDTSKKLLKSEIDPDGNGYSLNVTSDLQSVPFALSAKTVETENQKLTLAGNLLSISQGNSVDLSSLSGNASQWTTTNYGIDYSKGKVSIGNETSGVAPGAFYFHLKKKAVGTDRNMMLVENTSDEQDANASIMVIAGTGTNSNYLHLGTSSKTYFPNLQTSYLSTVTAQRLGFVTHSEIPSESRISFFTSTTQFDAPTLQERMRMDYLGNFGIGTIAPKQRLDVNGKVRIQDLSLDNTASKMVVADANGVLGYKDLISVNGGQWENNSVGINYSKGKVGIGTSTPAVPLEIKGYFTGIDRTLLALNNTSTDQDAVSGIGLGVGATYNGGVQVFSDTYFPSTLPFWTGRMHLSTNSKNGILFNATGGNISTNIEFAVGPPVNQETPVRMIVGYNGNVGIGTKTPKTSFHVASGDVYLDDATKGIIMKSANGQCWKVSVGNTGTLTSATVTCP